MKNYAHCSDYLCSVRRWTDRKSTRLNSSHVDISYAVFCLKKKKEETGMGSLQRPENGPATQQRRECRAQPATRHGNSAPTETQYQTHATHKTAGASIQQRR